MDDVLVKDLVTEKIEIEVSRQAEGQRLAVEQIVAEKCLAAGKCQVIGQWEHSDRRKKQRVGQRKEQPEINMQKGGKKEDFAKPPKLLLLSAVQFCSHQTFVFQP